MHETSHDHDLEVRAARADDADAIDRLILHIDGFHANARPDLFRTPEGSPRGEDFLKGVLNDPNQQILVGVLHGRVIGYVHILIKSTPGSSHRLDRRYSEIEAISVDPASQRSGVGRKLIEAAASWAEGSGVRDHQIAVHEFNKSARALYEKLGFAPSLTLLRRTSAIT